MTVFEANCKKNILPNTCVRTQGITKQMQVFDADRNCHMECKIEGTLTNSEGMCQRWNYTDRINMNLKIVEPAFRIKIKPTKVTDKTKVLKKII